MGTDSPTPASPARIVLLVEDNEDVRRPAARALSSAGFRVLEAEGIEIGFHLFQTQRPHLVVLDVALADGDGVELCRKIRAHKALAATPVIMLTGKGKFEEKAAGFEAGVDQYLVKPVLPRELLLWVQALLHRVSLDADESQPLVAGDVTVDPGAHLVRFQDAVVSNLTVKEFELLYILVKKRPQVLSRQWILSNLWRTVAVDNLVDTHLGRLRHKLPSALADRLQTVPGKGFRYFG